MKKRMLTFVLVSVISASMLTACKPFSREAEGSKTSETTTTTSQIENDPVEVVTTTSPVVEEITTVPEEPIEEQTTVNIFLEKPDDVPKNENPLPFNLNTLFAYNVTEVMNTFPNVFVGEISRRWGNQYEMYGVVGEVCAAYDNQTEEINKVIFEGSIASDFDKNAIVDNINDKEKIASAITQIVDKHIAETNKSYSVFDPELEEFIAYGSEEYFEYLQITLEKVIDGKGVLLLASEDYLSFISVAQSYPYHEISIKFSVQEI